jgi:hypothetical protein
MDKILAFSILSASPADLAAGGGGHYATRLSWRTISGSSHTEQQPAGKAPKQEQGPETERKQQQQQREARPRFAPEFDGLNCFESIVSY